MLAGWRQYILHFNKLMIAIVTCIIVNDIHNTVHNGYSDNGYSDIWV